MLRNTCRLMSAKHIKRALALLLLAVFLFAAVPSLAATGGLSGSGGLSGPKPEPTPTAETLTPYAKVNRVKGLTMTAAQKEYNRYSLTLELRIKNKTKLDYGYSPEIYLERYTKAGWMRLYNGVEFPMLEMLVFAGKQARVTLSLTDDAGRYGTEKSLLAPGRYRVVKPLYARVEKPLYADGSNTARVLAAEFVILPDTALYATEPVYFREGPGTEHPIIRELKLGEEVTLAGKSGKWSRVRSGERTGYVYSKYLTEDAAKAYRNHPFLDVMGQSKLKSVKPLSGDFSGLMGRGNLTFDAEILLEAKLKKPYAPLAMTLAVYADAATAKAKFELLRDEFRYPPIPDVSYKFYLKDNCIARWFTSSSLNEYTRAAEEFDKELQAKLLKLSDAGVR